VLVLAQLLERGLLLREIRVQVRQVHACFLQLFAKLGVLPVGVVEITLRFLVRGLFSVQLVLKILVLTQLGLPFFLGVTAGSQENARRHKGERQRTSPIHGHSSTSRRWHAAWAQARNVVVSRWERQGCASAALPHADTLAGERTSPVQIRSVNH